MKNSKKILIIFILMATVCKDLALNNQFIQLSTEPTLETSVSKAMIDVIKKFYIVNNIKFDFIIYGEATNHILDVINEVITKLEGKILIDILRISNIKKWNHKLNNSAVLFIKHKKDFLFLHEKSSSKKTKQLKTAQEPLKFLVYLENVYKFSSLKDLVNDKMKTFKQRDLRFFEFFLTKNKNTIELTAIVLYSEEKCGKFHLKHLNEFNLKTQKWEKKLENFNHFENFHGCLLSFNVEFYLNFQIGDHCNYKKIKNDEIERKYEVCGIIHEILMLIASKHNLTLHYTMIGQLKKFHNFDNFMANKNFVSQLRLVKSSSIDQYYVSQAVNRRSFYFLITENEFYTNYEKLLLPFDFLTWILLTVTLLLAFIIIFVSYGLPVWIQTILHGKGK